MPFDANKLVPLALALPDRQREVLARLGRCQNHKEIAADLRISPRTVGVHVQTVFHKLGICSRAQAVRVAMAAKMV